MHISAVVKKGVLVFLLLVAIVSLLQGLNNSIHGSQDNQWGPSRMLLQHEDPYAALLNAGDESVVMMSQYPNYPASGLIFLWPYAVWNWPVAKVLWAFSNLVFTIAILFCLFRLLPSDTSRSTKLLLSTLFLLGTPWRNGVGNGQHALFTLCFFLLAVVVHPKNSIAKGVLLAISWFKYTIAFPLTLFFARSKRGWIVILCAGIVHVLLTAFASIWVGTSPINLLTGPVQVAQQATDIGYMDVFAITTMLGLSSKLLPAVIALVILGTTFLAVRKEQDALSSLSTLSLAAMVVVFHLSYDFVVLVIPLAYALREKAVNLRAKLYLVIVAMIWFGDKAMSAVSNQPWFEPFHALIACYLIAKVILFYGALFTDWYITLKPTHEAVTKG